MPDKSSFWSFPLMILTDCVIDPVEVKTVSKWIESMEKLIRASPPVINESFLQEKMKRIADINISSNGLFIGIKNNNYRDLIQNVSEI
jgi:hypothetical protein